MSKRQVRVRITKRKEDLRLLRGIGKYVGDIHRVDMVHAVILRSSRAHARLVNIDASAAMALPGVIGVLTGKDMPGVKTIPMRTGKVPGLERSQQTPIVTTKARYVGKGSGEGGITAAGAAIANAVSNALGVEVKRLPLKPGYILELIDQGENGSS